MPNWSNRNKSLGILSSFASAVFLNSAMAWGQQLENAADTMQTQQAVRYQEEMPDSLARLYKNKGKRSEKELSEIRDRRVGLFERESRSVLSQLEPITENAQAATFEVIVDNYWVAMGCVVTSNGYAVTKASTLDGAESVRCRFGKNQSVDAQVVKEDEENDIALLRLAPGTYQPLSFVDSEPEVGSICLSVGVRDPLMAMGACSVTSRSLSDQRQPILGVVPRSAVGGILVSQVEDAARRAGIKDGDIITKLAGIPVTEVTQFVNLIRRHKAGQEVVVTTMRNDQEIEFKVRLSGRRLGPTAARFEAMNLLGSINSKRSSDFPWVMQHDSPLMPEQCGGPVLNLDGQAIGLNIARGGRIMSFAITGQQLIEVLEDFEVDDLEMSKTAKPAMATIPAPAAG